MLQEHVWLIFLLWITNYSPFFSWKIKSSLLVDFLYMMNFWWLSFWSCNLIYVKGFQKDIFLLFVFFFWQRSSFVIILDLKCEYCTLRKRGYGFLCRPCFFTFICKWLFERLLTALFFYLTCRFWISRTWNLIYMRRWVIRYQKRKGNLNLFKEGIM